MQEDTRKTLELFVEKARILAEGEFVQTARKDGLAVRLDVNNVDQSISVAHLRSETEALRALANTFRFFLQRNEKISFQNLPALYSDMSLNWVDHCKRIIEVMNARLSVPPHGLQLDGDPITLERIKEVFIYGELSHSTKREHYKAWEENRAAFPLMRFYFDNAVAEVLEAIFSIAYITEMELTGKRVPSLKGTFGLAHLDRSKARSEWRGLSPMSQKSQQDVLERIQAMPAHEISSSQPLPTIQFHPPSS